MDLTVGSETSANKKQTLGKHPKVNTVNLYTVAYGMFISVDARCTDCYEQLSDACCITVTVSSLFRGFAGRDL
jgi:hypothetical protein